MPDPRTSPDFIDRLKALREEARAKEATHRQAMDAAETGREVYAEGAWCELYGQLTSAIHGLVRKLEDKRRAAPPPEIK